MTVYRCPFYGSPPTAGVSTVNGVAPDGAGNVTLAAASIPFDDSTAETGSSNLQGSVEFNSTHLAQVPVIRSVADLPAAIGGVRTLTGSAYRAAGYIDLGTDELRFDPAGGVVTLKGFQTIDTIFASDRTGPVITFSATVQRIELADFSINNANAAGAGMDVIGGLAPGPTPFLVLVVRTVTIGASRAGTIANIAFGALEIFKFATWLDGLRITGIIGPTGVSGASIIDAGHVVDPGYRAIRVDSSAVIAQQFLVRSWNFDGLDSGARGVYLDPLAVYAQASCVRLIACVGRPTNTNYIDPLGLGADSSFVYVDGGTPDVPSTIYGGASFSDLTDYILVSIVAENTPVPIPSQSVALTQLAPLSLQVRVDLVILNPTSWRLVYTGAEEALVRLTGFVTLTKSGGGDFTTEIYATLDDGGGPVEIPGSRISALATVDQLTYRGSTQPFLIRNGDFIEFACENPTGEGTGDPRLFTFAPQIEKLP